MRSLPRPHHWEGAEPGFQPHRLPILLPESRKPGPGCPMVTGAGSLGPAQLAPAPFYLQLFSQQTLLAPALPSGRPGEGGSRDGGSNSTVPPWPVAPLL